MRATTEQFNQIVGWRREEGAHCACDASYVAVMATLDPECPLHREPSAAEVEAFDLSGVDMEALAVRMKTLVTSPAPTAKEG